MSADVAAVLEAAESLPAEQRRELIELLEAGLDEEITPTPTLSAAWWRVIEHRSAEYAAGRAETVPWSEVLARWESRRETAAMPPDHRIAHDALDRLPLTATLEEMSAELGLLAALRTAGAAADAGWVVPHADVERMSIELSRRLAAHEADPSRVLTWEQVEAHVRRAR